MITFPGSFLSDCRHVLILSAVGGGCGKSRQACARQQTCRKGREDQPSTALSQFFPCQKPTNSGGSSYAVGSGTHRRGLMRKRRGKPRLSDPGGAIGKLPGVGHRPRPPGVAPSARAAVAVMSRAGSIFLNANSIEPAGIMHRSRHEDGAREISSLASSCRQSQYGSVRVLSAAGRQSRRRRLQISHAGAN